MGSLCTSGPSKTTTNTSSAQTYTPFAQAQMQDIWNAVQNAASSPYQAYTQPMVANVNQTQQGGINNITGATSYLDAARNYAQSGASPISENDISRYLNPFTQQVINATQRNFAENNAQQQNQVVGNAALKGALGGDRVGVAQAELARQQKLAQDPVIAGLNQQNYTQALQAAQADRAAQAQGAYSMGALGNAAIGQGQSQIGAGTVLQGNDQQKLNAAYQEFMRAQQYPFQTAQFLASAGLPALTSQGGTQTGQSNSVSQQYAATPSPLQIGLGLGSMALGAFGGGGGASPFSFLGGAASNPTGWSTNPWSSAGQGLMNGYGYGYSRGGSVSDFADRITQLRKAFRSGGAVGYADGGKIYENDEPSPLDPPSGQDRDRAIRTILGEAANQGPTGMQAVASVIRNRAVDGGFGGDTPSGVVTARNQFEPWNTQGGRSRMMSIDPNSQAYQEAGAALDRSYFGDDPTHGATHFYAPKAQAALGRPAPSWDDGSGVDIGDHRFFGGAGEDGVRPVSAVSAQSRPQMRVPFTGAEPQVAPQEGRKSLLGLSDDARMGLIAAGLGILGSKAGNAFQAVGEGGLAGLKQYSGDRNNRQKNELDARKLLQQAEQFSKTHDIRERTLQETQRAHSASEDARKAQLERGKVQYLGPTSDGSGAVFLNQVNGQTEVRPLGIGPKGAPKPSAGQQALEKSEIKRLDEARKTSDSARASLATIDNIDSLLNEAWTGPVAGKVGSIFHGPTQTLNAQRDALALEVAQKMKGSFSDKDIAFLKNQVGNLGTTPAASKAITGMLREAFERSATKGDFLRDWYDIHGNLKGSDKAWQRYTDENPVFLEDKKAIGGRRFNPEYNKDYTKYIAGGAQAPAAAQPPAIPERPATVPAGSAYSPSRKMWRTPDGVMLNAQGEPVQ